MTVQILRSRIAVTLFGLTMLALAGFVVGREMASSSAEADDPIPVDNPQVPAERTPEWYVPYLEDEIAANKFHGEINGIELGTEEGPLPDCAQTEIRIDSTAMLTSTPYDLNLDKLPTRISLQVPPRVGVCADDGRVIWVIAQLEVAPGPGVNGDVGVVQLSRWENVRWYRQEFLEDRVNIGVVAGRPAVLADRGLSGFGAAAVFVVDDETSGSTMLISTNVDLDLLAVIMEAIYR
jgi:hypothetical protein